MRQLKHKRLLYSMGEKAFGMFILVLGVFLFIFCTISVVYTLDNEDFTTKTVTGNCYDRYHNKINELTCESVENDGLTSISFLSIILAISTVFIVKGWGIMYYE